MFVDTKQKDLGLSEKRKLSSKPRGGYIPSDFDGRDKNWRSDGIPTDKILLPLPPIKNQGTEVDSCTSMALCSAFEIIDARDGVFYPMSPLFNYYYSRLYPNRLGKVPLRHALGAAAKYGICQIDFHNVPSNADGALTAPNKPAIDNAKLHKLVAYDAFTGLVGYMSLDSGDRISNWRNALLKGFPVIVGLYTQSGYWQGDGMLEVRGEGNLGAHAVCIVGYDDISRLFEVLDSRGVEFANGGRWFLHYSVVKTRLVVESWTINILTYNY